MTQDRITCLWLLCQHQYIVPCKSGNAKVLTDSGVDSAKIMCLWLLCQYQQHACLTVQGYEMTQGTGSCVCDCFAGIGTVTKNVRQCKIWNDTGQDHVPSLPVSPLLKHTLTVKKYEMTQGTGSRVCDCFTSISTIKGQQDNKNVLNDTRDGLTCLWLLYQYQLDEGFTSLASSPWL